MALDFLKKIYFSFEDKWYSLLDKIDSKIRIYPIIDRIDEVVPSFVLFLLALVFLLVLMGYVLNFSSNYEATITVVDSGNTSLQLSGVHLFGSIQSTSFDEQTDSDGQAKIKFAGEETNFFGMMGKIILPSEEKFSVTLSAEKDGYKSINERVIPLDSLDYQLKLEKAGDEFGPKTVIFSDADNNPIADSTSYLRYICLNNQTTPVTVNDIDDGDEDGAYSLNMQNCNFQITAAGITGYTTSESFPKTLIYETTTLEFNPISTNTKGTAIINLYEAPKPATGNSKVISSPSRATVIFYKDGEEVERGIPGSNGTLSKQLDAGTYHMSVNHSDYYFIQDISFALETDVPKQVDVYLEWINPADRRTINLRVIDASTKIAISDATVSLQNVFDANIDGFANLSELPNQRDEQFTDVNGRVKLCSSTTSGSCTVRDGNILVVTVSKEGYVYKAFVPTLKPTSSNDYDDVLLESATALNSGTVQVGVKLAGNLKPLVGARTSLYYEFCMTGEPVCPESATKTILLYPRKFTEGPSGKVIYAGMLTGIYKARAVYLSRNAVSALSDKNALHEGGLIFFDLNINTALSELAVDVYDGITGSKISSADVNVNVYSAGDNTFSESKLSFIEKMPYSASSSPPMFVGGVSYDAANNYLIKVNARNYVPSTIPIAASTLAEGAALNVYKIKLYPISGLDGNVSIFFDNLYTKNDNPWTGKTFASKFDNNSNYYAKFDVVIGRDLNYTDLISMVKTKVNSEFNTSKTKIVGVPSAFYTLTDYSSPSPQLFNCEGSETDCNSASLSARCDYNYFFPTACTGTTPYIQAGTKWANSTALTKGTYSFAIEFAVTNSASEGDIVELDYRAKETHVSAVSSKTDLKKVLFVVGKYIQKGVFFDVKIKDARVDLSAAQSGIPTGLTAFFTGTSPKTFIANQVQPAQQVSVRVCNNSDASIISTNLKVASASSLNSNIGQGFTGNGYLFIDGSLLKSFPLQAIPSGECSPITIMTILPTQLNSNNWLLMDINASNKEYAAAISTFTEGGKIDLHAEFLAGMMDQTFRGDIYSITSADANSVAIANVDINVYTNCRTAPVLVTIAMRDNNYHLNDPSVGHFYVTINGIYAYNKDCIYVTVYPDNNEYETLVRQLYAKGDLQNPSLA
ncbi:MAG: hypothetical protein WC874_02765, partial [Candidatus Izemoplasmatales bacterium]